jgi:hypothetical protein
MGGVEILTCAATLRQYRRKDMAIRATLTEREVIGLLSLVNSRKLPYV